MCSTKHITIDLFSGAGGLAEGFRAEGFKCLFANDFDKNAIKTFARNHLEGIVSSDSVEKIVPEEIRKKLGLDRGQLDVLLGGPPCQGFSTYGKRDPNDIRNKLYLYYLSFLDEFRPKTFVFENVVGILSMQNGKVINEITKGLEKLGYGVKVHVLDSVNFGVPQFRKRVFILGAAEGKDIPTPRATHFIGSDQIPINLSLFEDNLSEKLMPAVTVREAISDLPDEALTPKDTHQHLPYNSSVCLSNYQVNMRDGSKNITHHSAKQMLGIRRFRLALLKPGDYGTKIRSRLLEDGLSEDLLNDLLGGNGIRDVQGCRTEDRIKEEELRNILLKGHINIDEVLDTIDAKGFANKYRRLGWDVPAHTLVAHMARDCSDFVHPEVDRFITVREAARLQSFPDTYIFEGSQFAQFKQIGNAVPPKLAAGIARAVLQFLHHEN
jgi:DNA (cytosine-5)-methyltransferase 1